MSTNEAVFARFRSGENVGAITFTCGNHAMKETTP
jgi:hypothetical protein